MADPFGCAEEPEAVADMPLEEECNLASAALFMGEPGCVAAVQRNREVLLMFIRLPEGDYAGATVVNFCHAALTAGRDR